MKNFLGSVLFTLFVLILGGFAYLRLGFAEVRGDLPLSNWKKALMFSSAHASVRRHAPDLPNPVSPTDENLIAGAKIYSDEGAGCHGAAGKPDQTSDSLYPPIPQLPSVGTTCTEAPIFWVAKHGIRLSGMFANGKWDSDQKLYIKRIQSLPPRVEQRLAKPEEPK